MAEYLLAAFISVYRVAFEPIEVFAGAADVSGPCGFHVEKRRTGLAGKLFETFAIFTEMIGIAYPLPLLIVSWVNAAESTCHQQNICIRFSFDLTNYITYGIYITTVADAADYHQRRFLIEHEFLHASRLFIPPAARGAADGSYFLNLTLWITSLDEQIPA